MDVFDRVERDWTEPTEPKIIHFGVCTQCDYEVTSEYEIYTDNSGNLYCSEECAITWNGIKTIEMEDVI